MICFDVTKLCNVVLYYTNLNTLICIIVTYKFVFSIGTNAMGSKSKKQAIIMNNSIIRNIILTRKIVTMQDVQSVKER